MATESVDKARRIITHQSRHLTRIVDDLLDMGRVHSGKILLERQPLRLDQLAGKGAYDAMKQEAWDANSWKSGSGVGSVQGGTQTVLTARYPGLDGADDARNASRWASPEGKQRSRSDQKATFPNEKTRFSLSRAVFLH